MADSANNATINSTAPHNVTVHVLVYRFSVTLQTWVLVLLPLYLFAHIFCRMIAKNWSKCGGPRPFRDHMRRALIVTAHPDDECMFFAPTIQYLIQIRKADVHVLCLTPGQATKNTNVHLRKTELINACSRLGIPQENVMVMRYTKLRDTMYDQWDTGLVAKTILYHIEQYAFDAVFTFDDYGVSGHVNHSSIYYALRYLYNLHKLPTYTRAYTLESVNLLRKYSGVIDVVLSAYSTATFCITATSPTQIRQAMRAHKSQLLWYRYLYLYTSRYIHVNSWRRITATY